MSQPTKIYKLMLPSPEGKSSYTYFTAAAFPIAAAQLFGSASTAGTNLQVASFEADLSAVNLNDFLSAGGMLIGPTPLK